MRPAARLAPHSLVPQTSRAAPEDEVSRRAAQLPVASTPTELVVVVLVAFQTTVVDTAARRAADRRARRPLAALVDMTGIITHPVVTTPPPALMALAPAAAKVGNQAMLVQPAFMPAAEVAAEAVR